MTANWGVHLFHATWQSAAVALLAIVVSRSFSGISSRLRYGILAIAMVKFALPPMLTFPLGLFSSLPRVGSPFFWPAERPFVFGPQKLLFGLMVLHAAGAIATAIVLLARAVRMHTLIRGAVRIAPAIVVSPEASVPFVYGVIRPTIVLPRNLGDEERRDVLEHESTHLRQNDSRHAAFQSALAIIWWWNPIYWMLSAELRRVREERCDDAILAAGASTPWRYSRSIVEVAAAASLAGVPMAIHPLEPRLRRIADHRIPRSARLTSLQLIALVLAALIFLPGIGRSPGHGREVHIHIHQ
jgi:hypothetical protein